MEKQITRILLIGDIHANQPALKAVLDDAQKHKYHQIWNLGDFVGYYPFPNEVVETLRNRDVLSIIGNYDLKVLAFKKNEAKWKIKKAPEKFLSFKWTYENLSKENREYLKSLPEHRRTEINGFKVLLTHGSPASNEEYICAQTTKQRLKELAELASADIVLSGHTHLVFSIKAGNTLFVNPGSVGRPEGTNGKATYAILNFSDKSFNVKNYEIEYDMEKTIKAIRKENLPENFIKMLKEGKNISQIQNGNNSLAQKQRNEQMDSVKEFAESLDYEESHSMQVTKLALKIFDDLKKLHKLSIKERFLLQCGSILHDIGWIMGQKSHHKSSLNRIVNATNLPFDLHQKTIIGLIARYHRKAIPNSSHKYFRDLNENDKHLVSVLASFLRVADGLDRSHMNEINDLQCKIDSDKITIILDANRKNLSENDYALKKSDLMQKLFNKDVTFEIAD